MVGVGDGRGARVGSVDGGGCAGGGGVEGGVAETDGGGDGGLGGSGGIDDGRVGCGGGAGGHASCCGEVVGVVGFVGVEEVGVEEVDGCVRGEGHWLAGVVAVDVTSDHCGVLAGLRSGIEGIVRKGTDGKEMNGSKEDGD